MRFTLLGRGASLWESFMLLEGYSSHLFFSNLTASWPLQIYMDIKLLWAWICTPQRWPEQSRIDMDKLQTCYNGIFFCSTGPIIRNVTIEKQLSVICWGESVLGIAKGLPESNGANARRRLCLPTDVIVLLVFKPLPSFKFFLHQSFYCSSRSK